MAQYHSCVCTAGAQSIAYFAGKSSDFAFAAAQADSVSTCLLQASTSVDSTVQVSLYSAIMFSLVNRSHAVFSESTSG